MELETIKRKCALCDSEEVDPLYGLPEMSIQKCARCGLVFNPITQEHDFDPVAQYSSDYYDERPDYYEDTGPASKERREALDSFGVGLDLLEKYQPSRGRLVDVGCGYGSFLLTAKERGWEACGVDISEHAASVASKKAGVEVKAGTLDEAGFADAEFDAVALNDSLEHFADPDAQLRQVSRILKPGGSLFLNTPNQDALLRVVAHAIYRLSSGAAAYPVRKLYHEFHLFYYSEETLARLLEKNGLEIVEMTRKPIPFIKARGSYPERLVVRAFSLVEGMLGREYEILAVARKTASRR
jgi:2-polyprenyl-3-methyl-5-hydroxy-6-metoxy-1,4-benzoquinol methylase